VGSSSLPSLSTITEASAAVSASAAGGVEEAASTVALFLFNRAAIEDSDQPCSSGSLSELISIATGTGVAFARTGESSLSEAVPVPLLSGVLHPAPAPHAIEVCTEGFGIAGLKGSF
jgi:hypothetical protein